jgi:hypothetical protein
VSKLQQMLDETFPAIAGSRFRRGFCGLCKEAIRIDSSTAGKFLNKPGELVCDRCECGRPPSKASVITPRQRTGLRITGG